MASMAWADTPSAWRRLMYVMWLLGFFIVGFGLALDHSGWDGWPFATNLATALAGALIGIPVVFFLLQQLAAQLAETASMQRGIRNLAEATESLVTASDGLVDTLGYPKNLDSWDDLARSTAGSLNLLRRVKYRPSEADIVDVSNQARSVAIWWNSIRPSFEVALTELEGAWGRYRRELLMQRIHPGQPHPDIAAINDIDRRISYIRHNLPIDDVFQPIVAYCDDLLCNPDPRPVDTRSEIEQVLSPAENDLIGDEPIQDEINEGFGRFQMVLANAEHLLEDLTRHTRVMRQPPAVHIR